MPFPLLFSPLTIRGLEIRNRVFSTGHQTYLARDNVPGPDMVAYHRARAAGGAGLIITEAARVHESAMSDLPAVDASTDACIPGYRAMADACHAHGCRLFGQVSHGGRVNSYIRGGLRGVPYSSSSTADHRFHSMPRAMATAFVKEMVVCYARAAGRFAEAGLDGIEVIASHGLLPAQFLNPVVNRREDEYGGSEENRFRFLMEIIVAVRAQVGEKLVVGVRISADELAPDGMQAGAVLDVCRRLDAMPALDYINTTAGTMAGLGSSVHVVPPMAIAHAYTAPLAAAVKGVTDKPVFVAGRINQPQIAEQVLASGQADMCGMTRAMIADPSIANKARAGDLDDICACIGCNQGCIGHYHMGYSITCIQRPETGRELRFADKARAGHPRKVLVAGGGPAGMKAAATAAQRGHEVTLLETAPRLGGQARIAERIPGRAEFGGLITNLEREMSNAGVRVRKNTAATADVIEAMAPDAVIIATGARPRWPHAENIEDAHTVDAWQVLRDDVNVAHNVVVADWRCDWIGLGVAEKLARAGCHVRLAVDGLHAGQNLQPYLRDHWAGEIAKLGVEVITYASFFAADADTAYFNHNASGEPLVLEDVETVVLALGHTPDVALEESLRGSDLDIHLAGDCLSPRTAEEAIYEGFLAGRSV